MKPKIDIALQALLGLVFFVFGLNGFLNFLPAPEPSDEAAALLSGLLAAPYFFPVLKIVETVAGLLLLIRYFSALALVLLAPIVVRIFLFHAFLDPAGLMLAIVLVALEAYLGFVVYRETFRPVLSPKPVSQ